MFVDDRDLNGSAYSVSDHFKNEIFDRISFKKNVTGREIWLFLSHAKHDN